jgi:hypothetical protein
MTISISLVFTAVCSLALASPDFKYDEPVDKSECHVKADEQSRIVPAGCILHFRRSANIDIDASSLHVSGGLEPNDHIANAGQDNSGLELGSASSGTRYSSPFPRAETDFH